MPDKSPETPTALDIVGLIGRGERLVKEVRLRPTAKHPAGATVLIRTLTEPEHIAFSAAVRPTADEKLAEDSFRRMLLAWTLCDEQGERIVPDEQIDSLRRLDAGDAMVIYHAAYEFVGFRHKELESARKN